MEDIIDLLQRSKSALIKAREEIERGSVTSMVPPSGNVFGDLSIFISPAGAEDAIRHIEAAVDLLRRARRMANEIGVNLQELEHEALWSVFDAGTDIFLSDFYGNKGRRDAIKEIEDAISIIDSLLGRLRGTAEER